VIVIVGNPAWRPALPAGPAGRACAIALAAAGSGRRVEIVGRAGDDDAGDALVLALSRAGVGHAALLRDAARPTPTVGPSPDDAGDGSDSPAGPVGVAVEAVPRPALDAADVALGLRYLSAFEVLVVTDDVPEAAREASVDAAAFSGARLLVLVSPGSTGALQLPADATVLAVPDGPDDGSFSSLVGAYAARLDEGVPPGPAFAAASRSSRPPDQGRQSPARGQPPPRRSSCAAGSSTRSISSGPSLRTLLTSGDTR
jgi:hypothetical protein